MMIGGIILAACVLQPVQTSAAPIETPDTPKVIKISYLAPEMPANPFPTDGAIQQNLNITLAWSGGDLDGEAVTYTVYQVFNDASGPKALSIDQGGTSYPMSKLTPNTVYFWRIVAKDASGERTPGPVWRFVTGNDNDQRPKVDVKINGGDTPVYLSDQNTFTVSWASTNAISCSGWGEMEGKLGVSGSYTTGPKAIGNYAYIISCSNSIGTSTVSIDLQIGSSITNNLHSITVGDRHACVLTGGGGIKCWAWNSTGRLEDGTTPLYQSIPMEVAGLSSGVVSISAGLDHTCALTDTGGVKCWGSNEFGQLGDGTTNWHQTNPVDVIGLSSGVVAISAGENHTCALTRAGGVKCWGSNYYGELGDGTTQKIRATPVDVFGLASGVISVAAGTHYTCALTVGSAVKCWGENQSLDPSTLEITNGTTPLDAAGLSSGVAAISAGEGNICGLILGGVKCWGNGYVGWIGQNPTGSGLIKRDVVGLSPGVAAIAAGNFKSCLLNTISGVKCWDNEDYGEKVAGVSINQTTAQDVAGLTSRVVAIAAGPNFECALTNLGTVKCWGFSDFFEMKGKPKFGFNTVMNVVGLP
jgi:hypothetical protein